jgi:glycosyltransferase involved in cell wall biosynthesis
MKPPVLFLEQQAWRAGGQRVLEDVLDALVEDFEPLVAFPEDGPFAAALRSRNIETLFYPLGSYRPGRKSWGEMVGFVGCSVACGLQLARVIARRGIRLIYINGPRCLPAGVLAARLTRTPSVFHLHRALTRKSDLLIAARAAAHVTKIVAVSQAAAASLVGANPNLASVMQVLYNPLRRPPSAHSSVAADSRLPAQLSPGGGPTVGMVGRITPQKGQMILLRAAAQLRDRWPNLEIVFVGAPEEKSREDAAYLDGLKSAAAELGLESNVTWAGYQSDPGPYYASLDLLALPSIESEGLPMVALEAMTWRVPAVASYWPGTAEIIRDGANGLLVAPGDERALAGALERVLRDDTLRAHLKLGAGASLDERFSPEVFRRQIHALVSNLIGSSRDTRHTTEKEVEARA